MRWVKRAALLLCGFLLVLATVIAGGLAWLGTGPGRAWLEATANRSLAGEARLTGVAGAPPLHVAVRRIDLVDEHGVWGRLHDVHLDVAPWDLLRARLTIERLSAATVEMLRPPVPRAQTTTGSTTVPPISVDVKQLTLASIHLPPDVFGEPTAWTATAAASLIGHDAALRVHVRELDPSPVRLDLRFELADERADAQATVEDPRGLLLRRAVGQALPLRLALTDDEGAALTPADWHGRLSATVGAEAQLQARLHLSARSGAREFDTDGEFNGASLLPAALRSVAEPTLNFHLAARDLLDTGWTVDGLELQSGAVDVKGTGTYLARNRSVEASLRLVLPDLGRFSAIAGATTAGSADVAVAAKGPLDALQAEVNVQGAHVAYGADVIGRMEARVDASSTPGGYQMAGEGSLAGLRAAGAPLPAHLGDGVRWKLAASGDHALQAIHLASFELSTAGLTLGGDGSLDRGSGAVSGTLHVDATDLSDFADMAPGLRGHGQVVARLDGTLSGPARVRLQGGLGGLGTGVPAADALIGGRLRLDVHMQRDKSGGLNLDEASLHGAGVAVTAHGTLDPATRQIAGDFRTSVDDLAVLQRAGLPAGGRLDIAGHVSGPPSAVSVKAHVDGAKLRWQLARIDRAALDLSATSAGAPAAHLMGEIRSRDVTVNLAADAGLSADRKMLSVSRLRMASGSDVIVARVRTALGSLLTTGQITADLRDLRRLSPLAGVELGGRLALKIALAARQGQTATLALAADNLSAASPGAAPMTVHHAAANASLAGVLRRPSGRFDLTGDGLSAAGASIRRLRVSGRAPQPDRVDMTADLAGDFKGPFTVTAAANFARDQSALRVTVERLNGRMAGTPLRLRQPLVVTARGPVLAMTNLALAIGDGTIRGGLRRDTSSLDLDIDAERLPVALAGHFAGRDDLAGTITARAQIAGPATQPRGRVEIAGDGLRAGAVAPGAPALSVAADAALAPGRLDVHAQTQVAGRELLSVAGTVPMAFGPQPGMAALAKDRPLNLTVRGAAELAQLTDFLPLAGERIAGHLDLALDIAGTPARPQMRGDLTLDHGRFEDLDSGLIVDALALDLGAAGDHVALRRLTGTDGGKGRLSGSGTASFGPAPSSNLTVSLDEFQALRRSDATLTASGSATIAGKLSAPALVARLTINHAEFFIPDPPPPSARRIPVTVIDSATGQVLAQPKEPSASSGAGAVTLDVAVHVPGQTFVRGRGLDSEWQGDIRARGSSAAPEVTGGLKVVHGTFSFFGKDMTLTRGTVTFTGGHKIAPNIDVLAETTTAEATFDVGATGTPDDLKLKLSSIPAMPQDEILSHLIFGRDVTRLSPAEGLQIAQAAATLSSGGPGMLDKVRHKLGLDVLDIGSMNNQNDLQPQQPQGSSSSASATGNTGVSGGKYIANGVYLGAEQGLSGETRSKVEVEVLPHVRVESEAGTRSEEVGVNWQMDY